MIMTISSKCKVVFTKMDKFQQWVVRKDAQWAKQVGIFGLLNIQLTLIKALVKELL
jgi:GTP-binding protein EngB required for normal cell division